MEYWDILPGGRALTHNFPAGGCQERVVILKTNRGLIVETHLEPSAGPEVSAAVTPFIVRASREFQAGECNHQWTVAILSR
jgi:hypothetical protein